MEILATARHRMGGEFKLVKASDDFYMYGTQQEFDSFWGVSVNRCGTLAEVLKHCLSIAELCKNNIIKYNATFSSNSENFGKTVFVNCPA
mgnify:CR=1 FL=1